MIGFFNFVSSFLLLRIIVAVSSILPAVPEAYFQNPISEIKPFVWNSEV